MSRSKKKSGVAFGGVSSKTDTIRREIFCVILVLCSHVCLQEHAHVRRQAQNQYTGSSQNQGRRPEKNLQEAEVRARCKQYGKRETAK